MTVGISLFCEERVGNSLLFEGGNRDIYFLEEMTWQIRISD